SSTTANSTCIASRRSMRPSIDPGRIIATRPPDSTPLASGWLSVFERQVITSYSCRTGEPDAKFRSPTSRMSKMNSESGTAVITGASSGIGAVYADRLTRRGYDLVLIARSADKLERVAERIRAESGRKVQTFPADLTDPLDLARVELLLK